jgi:RNA polymerase sigma-70 factor (ECF subfamily)
MGRPTSLSGAQGPKLSNPKQQDAELIQQALDGSQEAHRQLVLRYQRPVWGLLQRMVRDSMLAEDLAQEVFVKAFRALETFDRTRKFSSWLFKIAHNTAIDHLRRKKLDTVALETPDGEPDLMAVIPDRESESPDSELRRRDLARDMEASLERLRPEYREVVLLRFHEGLSYEEIAEVTGLPLGTVKTHIFRARKAMARYLTARGWEPKKR